jgi:hypothetical protein
MSAYVELKTGSAMIVSIDDSPSTIDPRSPVHVLPILAEPLPRELNDLIAQLVAFETRKRGGGVRRSVSLLQRMSATAGSLLFGAVFLAFTVLTAPYAMAQPAASAPPAVGVVTVERQPMTDSYEFNGRIQPINSVNIVARVTAWLDKQLFVEGTDVKKGCRARAWSLRKRNCRWAAFLGFCLWPSKTRFPETETTSVRDAFRM